MLNLDARKRKADDPSRIENSKSSLFVDALVYVMPNFLLVHRMNMIQKRAKDAGRPFTPREEEKYYAALAALIINNSK